MWLKRLVGVVMIITLVGMNALVVLGIVMPEKTQKKAVVPPAVAAPAVLPPPTIDLTVSPSSIAANATSALKWTTTGSPTDCQASGNWTGPKTQFGTESTGRIKAPGNYTYTITCTNLGGKAESTATITVGDAVAPTKSVVSSSTPSATAPTYCNGRAPCYSKSDVASHNSGGNCWSWNIDRVINVTALVQIHQVEGVDIETNQICGHDAAPSLSGSQGVPSSPSGHPHNKDTQKNNSTNLVFVGFFDSTKP